MDSPNASDTVDGVRGTVVEMVTIDGVECELELVKDAARRVAKCVWSIQCYEQANERQLRLNPRWADELTELREILLGHA